MFILFCSLLARQMLNKSPTKQNSFTQTKSSCSRNALSPSHSEEVQSKIDTCCLRPGSATLDKRNFTRLVVKGELNLHLGGVLALCRPWLKVSEVKCSLAGKREGMGQERKQMISCATRGPQEDNTQQHGCPNGQSCMQCTETRLKRASICSRVEQYLGPRAGTTSQRPGAKSRQRKEAEEQ